jgi:Flp pilus assembly protein TadD
VSWGTTLIAAGELDAAGSVVGRVARWSNTDFACAVLQANLYRALGRQAAWEAALAHARTLAGERALPASAAAAPAPAPLISSR